MTVLAWRDIRYRENIRLRFPSSPGFIQWKNLWHKDKGPRLNAKSSPGSSCISFPSWGAAGLVCVGIGNSPGISLLPVYLQRGFVWSRSTLKARSKCCLSDAHLYSCQMSRLLAPDFRKSTSIQHSQCLPVCPREDPAVQDVSPTEQIPDLPWTIPDTCWFAGGKVVYPSQGVYILCAAWVFWDFHACTAIVGWCIYWFVVCLPTVPRVETQLCQRYR